MKKVLRSGNPRALRNSLLPLSLFQREVIGGRIEAIALDFTPNYDLNTFPSTFFSLNLVQLVHPSAQSSIINLILSPSSCVHSSHTLLLSISPFTAPLCLHRERYVGQECVIKTIGLIRTITFYLQSPITFQAPLSLTSVLQIFSKKISFPLTIEKSTQTLFTLRRCQSDSVGGTLWCCSHYVVLILV